MLTIKIESRALSILKDFDCCRLLIVENGFFLDDETNEMLSGLGARIERTDGDASSPRPLNLFDAAIIDISLSAPDTFAWAEHLDELDIPYVFATNLEKNRGDKDFRPFRLCANREELQSMAQALFGAEHFD